MSENRLGELMQKGKFEDVKKVVDALSYCSKNRPRMDEDKIGLAILHSMDGRISDRGYYPVLSAQAIRDYPWLRLDDYEYVIKNLIRNQCVPRQILDYEAGWYDVKALCSFIMAEVERQVDTLSPKGNSYFENKSMFHSIGTVLNTVGHNTIEFGARPLMAKLREFDVFWGAMCGEDVIREGAVFNVFKDYFQGGDCIEDDFSINKRLYVLTGMNIYFSPSQAWQEKMLNNATVCGLKELTQVLPEHCIDNFLRAICCEAKYNANSDVVYVNTIDIRPVVDRIKANTHEYIRKIEMFNTEYLDCENNMMDSDYSKEVINDTRGERADVSLIIMDIY